MKYSTKMFEALDKKRKKKKKKKKTSDPLSAYRDPETGGGETGELGEGSGG
jgi:hypothetical protein